VAWVKSYFHRGGDESLLGLTIPEHFSQIARRHGDREAIVSQHQRRRLSYNELAFQIDRVARGLLALGFAKGSRIGIWATNNIEWLILQMATARIGAILVNINPANRPRELAHVLKSSDLQGLFTMPAFRSSNYVDMLRELLPELAAGGSEISSDSYPYLRRLVVYDPVAPEETDVPAPGFLAWPQFLEMAESVPQQALESAEDALDPDDPINIQYTSGTTGFPKAVVLSHHNILNNAYFAARAMNLTEADKLCVPVPFYHCFGMVLANLACLSVGACIVLPAEHFDARAVLSTIDSEKCSALHGVPAMFIGELEHPDFRSFDLSSLRTGIMAGAPCPVDLMRRVIDDLHCPDILIGYGQTEASPLTHLTERDDTLERRTETVGRSLPHQEAKIVDRELGTTLPLGEIGEVCFRGYQVMRGYYGNLEATADAIDSAGWLHSGDLGTMDGDGYVRITGRLKDMIIRGGENIYPAEIEACIFTHPKVAQVAVFGMPHERLGEEIVAWVQLHRDSAMTDEELKIFCREGLAHFKVPSHIRFVDEFPMTVTGKLQKFRMREIETEDLETSNA